MAEAQSSASLTATRLESPAAANTNTKSILDAAVEATEGVTLKGKDFGTAGSSTYQMTIPREGVWLERQLKAMCLKAGPMADQSMGNILCAIMYAEEMGLSVMLGDLYFVNGRLATTADAKIRHAMKSGMIEGYTVEITKGKLAVFEYSAKGSKTTFQTLDMHIKITTRVVGWKDVSVYEADLKDWINPSNAAWREHTEYMFRKNALSKALNEVAPLGVDADEIPAAANAAPGAPTPAQVLETMLANAGATVNPTKEPK